MAQTMSKKLFEQLKPFFMPLQMSSQAWNIQRCWTISPSFSEES